MTGRKPIRIVAVGLGLLLLVVLAGALFWMNGGPDAADFAHLREPRLSRMDAQRMLVIEARGDPNVVGAQTFKQIFSTYYALEGVSKLDRPPAPRARWPRALETPKGQWIGRYALPVPASARLPTSGGSAPAVLTTWDYGEVAEILHVGPYSEEQPTIDQLHAFVTAQGFRAVGEHEEEYVRGPGMWFAGNPDDYLTIIRLRVERAIQLP